MSRSLDLRISAACNVGSMIPAAEGEVLGIEVIGHGPITNPDVVNDRFTVSPPKLSADAAKTEERDPRQLPGCDLSGLGYRAGVSSQRINSTRWRRCP